MSIKHWRPDERPREKLIEQGAAALSDAELLAILLRVGTREMHVLDFARDMLNTFGSLHGIFSADAKTLMQYKGIGQATYTQFAVVCEISKRLLQANLSTANIMDCPEKVREYLRYHIGFESVEVTLALFLNQRNQVIKTAEISRGTVAENTPYIREIARKALAVNASALIVAHNHPAGSAEPSGADRLWTNRLNHAMRLIDVRLIDHFVITAQTAVSFAEHGWL